MNSSKTKIKQKIMLENKYQAETGWQMSESVKAVLTENFGNERKHFV